MFNRSTIWRALLGAGMMLSLCVAKAGAYTVLHAFCSQANCADGAIAHAGVIVDVAGNLYGTTLQGGDHGGGTVFRIAQDGTETVLYSFCAQTNCADGSAPYAGLVMDGAGNLYGATACGGADGCGFGAVFKLAPGGQETVLHAFAGGKDGADPNDLVLDQAGNLYGTTELGGGKGCGGMGCGTVFRISPSGSEKILYRFCSQTNCADGSFPWSALLIRSGNLYGTTVNGGANARGTVFELSGKKETVLYSFCPQANCSDGADPYAAVVADKAGNLYGTTANGGANSGGTVFKLSRKGRESVLHFFCAQQNCSDGYAPFAALIFDSAGNLYGTTEGGGSGSVSNQCTGCGVVFKVAADGTETVLHNFCSKKECTDGGSFLAGMAGLTRGKSGTLYGTAPQFGGNGENAGVAYSIHP